MKKTLLALLFLITISGLTYANDLTFLKSLNDQEAANRSSNSIASLWIGAALGIGAFSFDDPVLKNGGLQAATACGLFGLAQLYIKTSAENAYENALASPKKDTQKQIKSLWDSQKKMRYSVGLVSLIPLLVDFSEFYPSVVNSNKDVNLYFKAISTGIALACFFNETPIETQCRNYLNQNQQTNHFSFDVQDNELKASLTYNL